MLYVSLMGYIEFTSTAVFPQDPAPQRASQGADASTPSRDQTWGQAVQSMQFAPRRAAQRTELIWGLFTLGSLQPINSFLGVMNQQWVQTSV